MPSFLSVILVVSISLVSISNATCNLLQGGNRRYKDTESEAAIQSMCSSNRPKSMWEEYQCEYIQDRLDWQRCWPQRRMSTCPPGQLKGVAFLYHGFSACPDQYNEFAPKLQDECWHVYHILTVGHGYNFCQSSNDPDCIDNKFNLKYMPTSRQPYIEFVEMAIDIIEDEVAVIKDCEKFANSQFNGDALEVAVGGLSFGAALTAATAVLSGPDSVITKQIIMSPFLGISVIGSDSDIYQCTAQGKALEACLTQFFQNIGPVIPAPAARNLARIVSQSIQYYVDLDLVSVNFDLLNIIIQNVISFMVENPDGITNGAIRNQVVNALQSTQSWGEQCFLDIQERNRGGFCSFKVQYLFASASFAKYIVEQARDSDQVDRNIESLAIYVERDGSSANSMGADYILKFYEHKSEEYNSKATDCMWLIDESCANLDDAEINNVCGVPHSSMSPADNLGKPPYDLYWADTYHEGLISWLTGRTASDRNWMTDLDDWDRSSNQCVYLGLDNPPYRLIARLPSLVQIGFRIADGKLNDAVRSSILDRFAEITGINRDVLELSNFIIRQKGNSVTVGVDNVSPEEADKLENLIAFSPEEVAVIGQPVEFIQVNDEKHVNRRN